MTSSVTDYVVVIGSGGVGSLSVVVPYSTLIETGQDSAPFVASDSFLTASPPVVPIPTLGWWQLYLMMSLLGLVGLVALRRPVKGDHS